MLEGQDLVKLILNHDAYKGHQALQRMALAAVGSDSEHVAGCVCETPKKLLEKYGVLADPDEYNIKPDKDPPSLMVWLVLDGAKSWGEFLGGVLASWPHWTQTERDEVYPALMRSCHYAVEVGVDS